VLFALGAIVVPAAALAVLGWLSLRQWERSAELLVREQARDMAAMAAEKVEMLLRTSEEAIAVGLADVVAASGDRTAALDAWLAGTPLIERLYVFDRRGALRYPRSISGADAAVFAALLAEVSQGFWERGGRREVAAGDRVVLAAVMPAADGTPVLAALTWSTDGLRRGIFDRTLGGLEGPTILAVLDGDGRPVWTRASLEGAAHLVTVPFRDVLRPWRVAVYQPHDAMPRESVRLQVMVFTGVLGLLIVVILAGLVVTGRLVKHETEMARLKADFVANVSHDLKTPLSVIRMFGETLEMGRVPDEATRQEYYRVITREGERLTRLIDNVLDFSRIEGGRRRYEPVPTPVEPLVRETLDAFAYPLTQGAFTVDVDVPPDVPDVAADPEAVEQALANLIDNAIKYAGDRRAVVIEARHVGGEVGLTVADHGIGIPPAEHRRIFEKFYRVGRSDTQARRGSGVGLALVKHVAEAHGGRVTVESAPGQGSRFTLWLPVA
jgi:signal transduction histidine kinase